MFSHTKSLDTFKYQQKESNWLPLPRLIYRSIEKGGKKKHVSSAFISKKKMNLRKFIIKILVKQSSLKQQTLKSNFLHTLRCTLILKDLTLLPLYALSFHILSISYKQNLMKFSLVSEKTCQGLRITETCCGTQDTSK